jgi:hypothetical protein
MKRFVWLLIAALAASLLGTCAFGISDSEEAKENLVAFFEFLNRGAYDKAVELYGGGYETLVEFNPALDPEDRPALLKNGCEINGLQCLTVLTADFKEKNSKGEYIFVVQFKDADGKLFVQQTPNASPVFIFEYRVMKGEDGTYRVLDLPVYIS